MSDFDNQITDAFYGAGKPITTECLLFRETFNRVAKGTPFTCVLAWLHNGRIVANIRKTLADGAIEGLRGCALQADYETRALGILADFDVVHTRIPAAKRLERDE
jgi:hypothetical protein